MAEPENIADLARNIRDLTKLLEERPAANPFSAEEIERIKRAADLVEWFDTLGWIGKRLLAITAGIVLLISQYERIVQFFGGAK